MSLTKEQIEKAKKYGLHGAAPFETRAEFMIALCDMALRALESVSATATPHEPAGFPSYAKVHKDLSDAMLLLKRMSGVISATPAEVYKGWSMGSPLRLCEQYETLASNHTIPLAAAPVAATGAQEAVAWWESVKADHNALRSALRKISESVDHWGGWSGIKFTVEAALNEATHLHGPLPAVLYAAPQPVASAPEPSAGVFRWIDDVVKLLKAVRASEAGGIGCHEVEGRNWFDAQDTLLSGVPCQQEDLGFGSPADKAASARPEERDTERAWLVWSNKHRSYWGADRCGYRDDPREAGRYTLAEARSICRVRSMETVPPEAMIHEADVLRGPFMNSGA